MKAFRFSEWQKPATWEDVPIPEPGAGEVLIRIGGAGACHSDLHIMHEWTPENFAGVAHWRLPFTLGHENAGWIEGGDTRGLDVGAPVVVSPTWSCGLCAACRSGDTNCCESAAHAVSGGLGLDGGIAEYMLAPVDALVPLRSLEPWRAAPLTDAGLTSYHAVKRSLPVLTPDATAVVIGVGGLGHMAIEFLRELSGARIIAVDVDENALAMAADRGADLVLPSDERATEEIRKATNGLGAMAILDFVGVDATLRMAAGAARKRGRVIVIGIGGGVLPFSYGALPFGCSIVSTLGGTTGELAEIVALAEAGRIAPHIERYEMQQTGEVYEKLAGNQVKGRAVLVP